MSTSEVGKIQLGSKTKDIIPGDANLEIVERGSIQVKGILAMA
jgi:hypothetical protein